MRKKVVCLFVCMLMGYMAMAQIAVGSWRSHASFSDVTALEETPNRIFAVGDNHLFSISKSDHKVSTFTKCDNMSDNNVSCIRYDNGTGNLLIVYANANIDLIDSDGNVYNIPDLYNKNLLVDKGVNSIYFYKGLAYLSTNFGIVVINIKKREIKDTYIIGDDAQMLPVYAVTCDGVNLYALMGNVIKCAPLKGVNLLDYNNWSADCLLLPDVEKQYDRLAYFGGKFVISAVTGDILVYSGGEWTQLVANPEHKSLVLRVEKDYLVAGISYSYCTVFDTKWQYVTKKQLPGVDWLVSESVFYTAANREGVSMYVDDETPIEFFTCSGPVTGYSQNIRYDNGCITVAPGFSWINRGLREGGVYFFKDDKWVSYTDKTTGAKDITPDGFFNDVVSVAIDPKDNNHVFASTWGEGVYEFKDGKAVALHTSITTNNVIKAVSGIKSVDHYTRVDGLNYDSDGNLWVTSSVVGNQGGMNCVGYMTPDGEWKEATGFSPLETCATIQQMLITSNGQKWFRSARYKPGVFVKTTKGSKFFTSFTDKYGNTLTPMYIYALAEDKSGNVWVGTNEGPIIFTNTSKVLESSYRVNRIKIAREDGSGLADFLLNGISVTAIAVDGGNRVWLGTSDAGLYLVSNDGQTEYNHFTTDNSPLPSNNISALAMDPKSGELFIGTADGIVSYRDGTTDPQKTLQDKNIKVFPNPVNPDYNGLITVVGLEDNCVVRVVDASGNYVAECRSFGGTMTWDGKDRHGDNVASGVYFFHIFNTDEDNSRSACAKVLIIR